MTDQHFTICLYPRFPPQICHVNFSFQQCVIGGVGVWQRVNDAGELNKYSRYKLTINHCTIQGKSADEGFESELGTL